MGRRTFSREYKLEAVRLVRDRGVHENVLPKWVKDWDADPRQAFLCQGQMKPEQGPVCGRQI